MTAIASAIVAVAAEVAIIIGVVVLVVIGFAIVIWRRTRSDSVQAFQEHIDALSPEARRPVVDRVQQLEEQERMGQRNSDKGGGRSFPTSDDERDDHGRDTGGDARGS